SVSASFDVATNALGDANGLGTPPAAAAAPAETSVTAPIATRVLRVRRFLNIGSVLTVDVFAGDVTAAPPKAASADSRAASSPDSAGPRSALSTACRSAKSALLSTPGAPEIRRSASSLEYRGVTPLRSSEPCLALQQFSESCEIRRAGESA